MTDLIVGTDGSLYGTCIYGGLGGNGSIFKIPLNGSSPSVKTLASFGVEPNGNPDDGSQPLSLVQGNDGNIYFTNASGVYKLDSSGDVSDRLHLCLYPRELSAHKWILPDIDHAGEATGIST